MSFKLSLMNFRTSRLKLVLVDHNRLSYAQSRFKEQVEMILDHHQDEFQFTGPIEKEIVRGVGSCSTLVAEKFIKETDVPKVKRFPRVENCLKSIVTDLGKYWTSKMQFSFFRKRQLSFPKETELHF